MRAPSTRNCAGHTGLPAPAGSGSRPGQMMPAMSMWALDPSQHSPRRKWVSDTVSIRAGLPCWALMDRSILCGSGSAGKIYLYKHWCNKITRKCNHHLETKKVMERTFISIKWTEWNNKHRGADNPVWCTFITRQRQRRDPLLWGEGFLHWWQRGSSMMQSVSYTDVFSLFFPIISTRIGKIMRWERKCDFQDVYAEAKLYAHTGIPCLGNPGVSKLLLSGLKPPMFTAAWAKVTKTDGDARVLRKSISCCVKTCLRGGGCFHGCTGKACPRRCLRRTPLLGGEWGCLEHSCVHHSFPY